MSLTNSQVNNPTGYGIIVNTSGTDVVLENNVISGWDSRYIYAEDLLGALNIRNNTYTKIT
jgi:hypothetical protein